MTVKFEDDAQEAEVIRSTRHATPTHYTFKIQQFSSLSKLFSKYQSQVFEVAGYKWKLVLHPNGKSDQVKSKDHISLYLAFIGPANLHSGSGWEVNAQVSLFMYDQIKDKYVTIEDDGDRVRRFNRLKTEWGYAKLIPLDQFKDPSNGYLVNDTCIFGVEVFVLENTGRGECLSMINNPTKYIHTWKIEKFSKLKKNKTITSDMFVAGNQTCNILLYPNGFDAKNKYISVYLQMNEAYRPLTQVCAKLRFRMKDQLSGKHKQSDEATNWHVNSLGWGWSTFMELSDLNDPEKGFLVNNTMIVEAEVTVLATVTRFK